MPSLIPTSIPGHGKPVCMASELRAVLFPLIEEEERIAVKNRKEVSGQPGVKDRLALRASQMRGLADDAGRRRLYDLEYGDTRIISIDWADSFLLAIERHIGNEALPVMPGSLKSAREMVAAMSDYGDEPMTLPEQDRLTRQLFRFARGYVYAERVFDRLPDELGAAEAIGAFLRAFAPEPQLAVAA